MVRTLRAGSFFQIVQVSDFLALLRNVAERSAAHFDVSTIDNKRHRM
jgi:hypothetical protein